MSIESNYQSLITSFNFTNSIALPDDFITPVNGVYTFSYNFLIDQNSLLLDGDYDVLEGTETDIPENQNIEYDTFSTLNSVQKDALQIIMHQKAGYDHSYSAFFSDVTSVSFSSDTPQNANINFGQVEWDANNSAKYDPASSAYTISFDPQLPPDATNLNAYSKQYDIGAHGDIWLNSGFEYGWSSAELGSLQFATLLHEVGHSLGLVHPGENSAIDNQKYTIMSYNPLDGMGVYETLPVPGGAVTLVTDASVLPSTLQLYDIAALQEIYGSRNYSTRDTDTTYSKVTAFASTAVNDAFIYTIWDGGDNDTIDVSGYTNPQGTIIDLRQGEFSSVGYNVEGGAAIDNLAIAYHTIIEDAVGTANADILIGNAWDNKLEGGLGNDTLYGDGVVYRGYTGFGAKDGNYETGSGIAASSDLSGIDELIGGAGNDNLFGGAGNDILRGGSDNDYIEAGAGDDTIIIESGHDFIDGGIGYDQVDFSELLSLGIQLDYFSVQSNTTSPGIPSTFQDRMPDETKDFVYSDINSVVSGDIQDVEKIILTSDSDVITYNDLFYTNLHRDRDGLEIDAGDGDDTLKTYNNNGLVLASEGIYNGSDSLIKNVETVELQLTGDTTVLYRDSFGNSIPHPFSDIKSDSIYISDLSYDIDHGFGSWSYDYQSYVGTGNGLDITYSGTATVSDGTLTNNLGGVLQLAGSHNGDTVNLSGGSAKFWSGQGDDTITGSGTVFYSGGDDYIEGGIPIVLAPAIVFDDITMSMINYTADAGSVSGDLFIQISGYGSITIPNHYFIFGTDYDAPITLWEGDTIDMNISAAGADFDLTSTLPVVYPGRIYEGSPFDDAFSSEDDVIQGHGGDDNLWGFKDGDQVLQGGYGDDHLVIYDGGENYLYGGHGNDSIWGGTDSDRLYGGYGDDNLIGEEGDDYLYGGDGVDAIWGKEGDDHLYGGRGYSYLYGGEGEDKYYYEGESIYISEFDGVAGDYDSVILQGGSAVSDIIEVSASGFDAVFQIAGGGFVTLKDQYAVGGNLETEAFIVSNLSGTEKIHVDASALGYFLRTSVDGGEFNGTDNDDVIVGANGSDIIMTGLSDGLSGYGADVVYAGRGDDTIYGGNGNDLLYGEYGSDTFYGGDGRDTIYGGDGDDIIYGEGGIDFIDGGDGANQIYSGDGNDIIQTYGSSSILDGGLGDDYIRSYATSDNVYINGGEGNDDIRTYGSDNTIDGGDGDDLIIGGAGNDIINGDANDDTLSGGAGNDTINGGDDNDILLGNSGDDIISGDNGDDLLNGNVGNDIIYGGAGIDTLFGDEGEDTLYTGAGTGVLWDTPPSGYYTWRIDDSLFGGSGNDTLYADDVDFNAIVSGDSADKFYLNGGDGGDILNGNNAGAKLEGGNGDDIAIGGTAGATFIYTLGDDSFTITQNAGSTLKLVGIDFSDITFETQVNNAALSATTVRLIINNDSTQYIDILDGLLNDGQGNISGNLPFIELDDYHHFDVYYKDDPLYQYAVATSGDFGRGADVQYGPGPTSIASDSNDLIFDEVSIDALDGNDVIHGTDQADNYQGGDGNDILYGMDGADTLDGGNGEDILIGGAGNDTINGGAGIDVVDYSNASSAVTVNIHSSTASDGDGGTDTLSNVENAIGSDFNDVLVGNNAYDNTIWGGLGNDDIQGRNGSDILYGEDGIDVLKGGNGDDILYGGDDTDILYGHAGNDTLYGDGGDDSLYGHDGNDILYGGTGDDHLKGYADNDTLHGEDGADNLYGDEGDDILNGGAGDDLLVGDADDDILRGGDGTDNLYGEDGLDTLIGGSGLDFLYGGIDTDKDVFGFSADEDSFDRIYNFDLATDEINITDMLTGYTHGTSNIDDFVLLVHAGSRFDVRIDVDGGADNFVNTARVLTDIDNSLTAEDLLNSGALVANETLV